MVLRAQLASFFSCHLKNAGHTFFYYYIPSRFYRISLCLVQLVLRRLEKRKTLTALYRINYAREIEMQLSDTAEQVPK